MLDQSSLIDADALLAHARTLLAMEARALAVVGETLDLDLIDAAGTLAHCRGRVVISGVGKSGIAARKIAATLCSLGRPAQFLHASDALHGDLGAIAPDDAVIAVSVSGQSRDLLPLVTHARANGCRIVCITASLYSPLAEASDHVLLTGCRDDDHMATPTASTIATIALGDALAMLTATLARAGSGAGPALHPGGDLGRRRRSVSAIAHRGDRVPLVPLDADAQTVFGEMTAKGFGITGVIDAQGALVGTISDGDIRRHFDDIPHQRAQEMMVTHPVVLETGADIGDAMALVRAHRISALFVVAPGTMHVDALVHLQDLLRVGVI